MQKEAVQKIVSIYGVFVYGPDKSDSFVPFVLCLRRFEMSDDLIKNTRRSITLIWL